MNNQEMGQRYVRLAYDKNEEAERATQGRFKYEHFIDIQTQLLWAGVYFLADIAESLRDLVITHNVETVVKRKEESVE